MTEDEVRELLLKRAAKCTKSRVQSGMAAWCRKHGVNRHHAYEFIAGRRGPCADLLDGLGLEYRIVWKRRAVTKEESHDA